MIRFVLILLFVHNSELLKSSSVATEKIKRQNLSCGTPNIKEVALILRGQDFTRGAWPWMVAIFKRNGGSDDFICSGTLVSTEKVVTGKRS